MCLVFFCEVKELGYIALYRKYRPNTFDSIIGQENVTKILKIKLKMERYLMLIYLVEQEELEKLVQLKYLLEQ